MDLRHLSFSEGDSFSRVCGAVKTTPRLVVKDQLPLRSTTSTKNDIVVFFLFSLKTSFIAKLILYPRGAAEIYVGKNEVLTLSYPV